MNNENLPPDSPVEPAGVSAAPIAAPPPADARSADAAGWERSTMERLLFATLEEQKSARRWRAFVRLAWLAFFIFLVWAITYRGSTAGDKLAPHTAVIEIEGEIGPK